MRRARRAHWRHVATTEDHLEAFRCEQHARYCRRVWVREEAADDAAVLAQPHLLELDRAQVRHVAPSGRAPAPEPESAAQITIGEALREVSAGRRPRLRRWIRRLFGRRGR